MSRTLFFIFYLLLFVQTAFGRGGVDCVDCQQEQSSIDRSIDSLIFSFCFAVGSAELDYSLLDNQSTADRLKELMARNAGRTIYITSRGSSDGPLHAKRMQAVVDSITQNYPDFGRIVFGVHNAGLDRGSFNFSRNHQPKFALKTNLVYLAALCLNIEGELFLAKRLSLNLEYQLAWWSNPVKHQYYRLAAVSPELRYWFAPKQHERFKGHFVGLYAGGGIYEFMFNPSWGIQGEFFVAAGLTYGYAWQVNRWLNMELSLGLGYMMSEYRQYYHYGDCYVYRNTSRFTYIGPTKAKVSLVFPLLTKRVR